MKAFYGFYYVLMLGFAVVAYDMAKSYGDCQTSLHDQIQFGALMRSGGKIELTSECAEMQVKAEVVEAVVDPRPALDGEKGG